jgi:hypothetical protein
MIILYKNSARVGSFIDCAIERVEKIDECFSIEKAADISKHFDCVVPKTDVEVIPCSVRVRVCNEKGDPFADVSSAMSPDLFYFRCDRGPLNVFHQNTRFLIPAKDTIPDIQIATKDRLSAVRGILKFEFVYDSVVIARSKALLILSKPPSSHKLFPFANCIEGKRIPMTASSIIKPWKITFLGSYRTQPIDVMTAGKKRPREEKIEIIPTSSDSTLELEIMREKLSEALCKLAANEKESLGLKKALKLLSET